MSRLEALLLPRTTDTVRCGNWLAVEPATAPDSGRAKNSALRAVRHRVVSPLRVSRSALDERLVSGRGTHIESAHDMPTSSLRDSSNREEQLRAVPGA